MSSYKNDFDPIELLNWFFRTLLILMFSLFFMSQCSAQERTRSEWVEYIEGFGIQHAEIVYAQMMLESGNLNCKNCSWSNYNNAFGFHNGKRYLIYDNLEHCLEGFKEWQDWRCPDCETEEEYLKCLVKNWGAPNMIEYVEKIKAI